MNSDPENENPQETTTNRLKQSAQQAAKEVRGQLSSLSDKTVEKASGMLGAAKEKLGSMSESAKSAASAARDRAGELFGGARDSASEAYTRARDRVGTLSEDGLQFVRDNPGKSIVAALLAGMVVGLTMRRH